MTIKELNEYERLIVEILRLELLRCDVVEEEGLTPKGKQLNEEIRSIVRTQSEIWFDIIALLRQQERIKRLREKAKEEAKVKYKSELERLNRKWAEYRARRNDGKAIPMKAKPT